MCVHVYVEKMWLLTHMCGCVCVVFLNSPRIREKETEGKASKDAENETNKKTEINRERQAGRETDKRKRLSKQDSKI